LMEVIKENIEMVTDLASANDAMERIAGFHHIFDSKVQAGVLLNAKCRELGLKYNKLDKRYEAA